MLSKFLNYSIIKIVNVLFFVTIFRTLNTYMWFKGKVRNITKGYMISFFYVNSVTFLFYNRMS